MLKTILFSLILILNNLSANDENTVNSNNPTLEETRKWIEDNTGNLIYKGTMDLDLFKRNIISQVTTTFEGLDDNRLQIKTILEYKRSGGGVKMEAIHTKNLLITIVGSYMYLKEPEKDGAQWSLIIENSKSPHKINSLEITETYFGKKLDSSEKTPKSYLSESEIIEMRDKKSAERLLNALQHLNDLLGGEKNDSNLF